MWSVPCSVRCWTLGLGAALRPFAVAALAALLSFGATGSMAETPQDRFGTLMDSVFGAGQWRLTGGYRSPERENELRRQGAMTVRPGALAPFARSARGAGRL